MDNPQAIEAFIRSFENDREAEGWDMPPSVWMLLNNGQVEPLVRALPDGVEPPEFIIRLVKKAQPLDSTKVRAVLVSMEGWILPQRIIDMLDMVAQEDAERAHRMFKSLPEPSTFPDRQDVRSVIMVDYLGNVYAAGRIRGDDQQFRAVDRRRGPNGERVAESLKVLLGVHPRQNIQRVVDSCIEDVMAIMKRTMAAGTATSADEDALDELIERILTAYKIHMPEEYDEQLARLQAMTGGRFPRRR